MSAYCGFVAGKGKGTVHESYHNEEYGFPLTDDNELFGRLVLEMNQAGLSWETILKKKEGFEKAYNNFDIKKVAKFGENDIVALMNNPEIIRNRLKINAAIHNAQKIIEIQKEYGSFLNWLESHHPLAKADWVKLFKKAFKFTGGEVTGEFLMSIGFLPGSHAEDCPVYKKIMKKKPMWAQKKAPAQTGAK